jgi:hypothetical protein
MIQNFFRRHSPKRLPHSFYSHEISPSDFYPFRKGESALTERKIPDGIDFCEVVTEILNGISDAELQRVFRSWIEHAEMVFDEIGRAHV